MPITYYMLYNRSIDLSLIRTEYTEEMNKRKKKRSYILLVLYALGMAFNLDVSYVLDLQSFLLQICICTTYSNGLIVTI